MMDGMLLVQQAMYQHLTSATGALVGASLVAWPNTNFTPPSTGLWYEAAFMPGEPSATGIGGDAQNRFVGIFQVTVCAVAGIGEGTVVTEAERIAKVYKRGTVIIRSGDDVGTEPSEVLYPGDLVVPINWAVAGKITKSWRGPGFVSTEPACYQVPVSVQFWADAAN